MCQLRFILFALAAGRRPDHSVDDGASLLQLRSIQSGGHEGSASLGQGLSPDPADRHGGSPTDPEKPSSLKSLPAACRRRQAATSPYADDSTRAQVQPAEETSEALSEHLPGREAASPHRADAQPQHAAAPGSQRVLFGVQTSATPVYAAKLTAGLESWLRAVPAEDRIIVGPRCEDTADPSQCASNPWEASTCGDKSQLCKHLALLDRAYGKDFDWFVTLGEDHVVMTDLLKASLAYLDPAVPAALASIGDTEEDGGCGQLWKYSKGSKNGTLPMAHGWVEPSEQQSPCLAVQKRGGLCGGTGIIYSRAAVDRLFADGREAFWNRMQPLMANNAQYDTGMSCALLDRGVKLNQGCGLMLAAHSLNIKDQNPANPANINPNLIYHVAGAADAPKAMHVVWAQMLAKRTESLAWRRAWKSQCLEKCSIKGFCRAPAGAAQGLF